MWVHELTNPRNCDVQSAGCSVRSCREIGGESAETHQKIWIISELVSVGEDELYRFRLKICWFRYKASKQQFSSWYHTCAIGFSPNCWLHESRCGLTANPSLSPENGRIFCSRMRLHLFVFRQHAVYSDCFWYERCLVFEIQYNSGTHKKVQHSKLDVAKRSASWKSQCRLVTWAPFWCDFCHFFFPSLTTMMKYPARWQTLSPRRYLTSALP